MKEEVKGFPGWHIKTRNGSHDFVLYTLFNGRRKHVEIVGHVMGALPGAFHTGHVQRVHDNGRLTYDIGEARPLEVGVFRQMIQQIANKYPEGLHSQAYQTSNAYAGSLKKMPTYKFDDTQSTPTHRILPEKPDAQLARSSPFEFKTPEAEAHWQQLIDQHGKDTVHGLFSIPEGVDKVMVKHVRPLNGPPDLQVTSYLFPSKVTGYGHMDSTRTLTPDMHLWNDLNNIKGHPPGTGTKMFARQVLAARKMGIKGIHIETAVTDDDGHNGGYTWPRLGFNGPIRLLAKKDFPGHKDMHSIFATEEGAMKWKDWGGSTFDLHFDPHPDSEHSKRLLAYMKSKGLLE